MMGEGRRVRSKRETEKQGDRKQIERWINQSVNNTIDQEGRGNEETKQFIQNLL
jgi:hypothetical protein